MRDSSLFLFSVQSGVVPIHHTFNNECIAIYMKKLMTEPECITPEIDMRYMK